MLTLPAGSPGSPRVIVQTQRIFHHTRHQISNEVTQKVGMGAGARPTYAGRHPLAFPVLAAHPARLAQFASFR